MGVRDHYDALPAYGSYDLQWLGPIVYPLTFAVLAQVLVLTDMACSHVGRKFLGDPCKCGRHKLASPPEVDTMDARINLVALLIMFSEIIFAVCCIIQCILNYHEREFVGTRTACDVQAAYATYYTFSAIGLAAFGVVVGWRVIVTGGTCPLFRPAVLLCAGVAIHLASLLVALLPLFGLKGWLFATDYCMFNIESPLYCTLFLLTLGVSALVSGVALCKASSRAESAEPGTAAPKRHALRLLYCTSAYLLAAWLTTCVIAFLYIANGAVYSSGQWRVYGAQAIILHSNQLFVPLLFGWLWRHAMQAVVASSRSHVDEN